MTYEEIKDLTLQLSYRDKFRLAQLLIQVGRKEEEEQYVEKVKEENITKTAQILVGWFMGDKYSKSKLYDKTFTHEYRTGVEK